MILANFNHERWMMVCNTVQIERAIVEECFQWANQRVIFGKSLLEQPVVRSKCVLSVNWGGGRVLTHCGSAYSWTGGGDVIGWRR